MKKLLTVLAASVGIAAFADTTPPLSATSFESATYTAPFSVTRDDDGGEVSGNLRTWAGNADADGDTNVITAYGDATPPENRPDYYDGQEQSKFLKVDSTAGLARYVNAGGDAQGLTDSNVYFDMDVQFTVSDSVQPAADGDKLLVWLYAPDTENAQTNLIITAATLDSSDFTPVSTTNYIASNVTVVPDTWYRLTVVSEAKEVAQGVSVPVFKVYIDETLVTARKMLGETGPLDCAEISEFNSLVAHNATGGTTLTSVTFKGTGAVDDLVVTTVKPSFIQEEVETKYFQVGGVQYATFKQALANAGSGTITMLADYDVATEDGIVFSAGTVTLDMGTFNLTDSRAEGDYAAAITVSGGALTIVGSGSIGLSTIAGSDSILVTEGGTLALGAENASVPGLTGGLYVDGSYTVKVWGSAEPEFKPYDESETAFTWTAPSTIPGYYVITTGEAPQPEDRTIDGGAGNTVNVTATTVSAAAQKFSTSADKVTDAQILAYIVGGTVVDGKAVVPTPTISVDGTTVTVVCSGADSDYLVQYYLDYKTDLTAAKWTEGTTPVAATGDDYTATLKDEDATAPQKFYRVRAVVSNKLSN